ncbi:MAG: nucleotidyltransferase domain-containing protein [Alphaproteobacteria bacterium]
MTAEAAISNAEALFVSRYQGAEFCVASGSIIQGHGALHSDLDLVVIYSKIPAAYRESFFYQKMPVEAFVHDYETIQSFMDDDYQRGNVSMQHMLATGKIVPHETESSAKLKVYAQRIIAEGLNPAAPEKIEALRYSVSDLIDDLKDDRPVNEVRSILYSLYHVIGELHLRLSGQFLATGKHLARKLKDCDPAFSAKLDAIMTRAHTDKISDQDIEALLSLLQPLGGNLFDGYKQTAPSEKRAAAKWLVD